MSFQLIGYGEKSIEKEVFAYFKDEWRDRGRDTWNETYTDYAMYLFDRAFREGGVASTYWDLTFPIMYESLMSGLAYRLADGRAQSGYNGWNVRRFYMRLWALACDYGLSPGAIGAHSTNAYVFVALAWLDAVLDGERDFNLDISDMDWIDYHPIERVRTMSSPHNWGVGICWMSNFKGKTAGQAKQAQTEYVWMHDSWLNPYMNMKSMPRAVLDWGMNGEDVEYYPYWRNPYASCRDKDILVSVWRLPSENRAVVGVFNYNPEKTKDVVVSADLAQLGLLPADTVVRNLYSGAAAEMTGDGKRGTLRVTGLPKHHGVFFGLAAAAPEAVEQAAKNLPEWAPQSAVQALINMGFVRGETRFHAAGAAPGVTCDNADIEIGMWQLPDRVLLAVRNTSDKPVKTAALKLDLDALELRPRLPWQEFIGLRNIHAEEKAPAPKMDYYGQTLSLDSLPANSGRLVAVRRY
jgi:hypothetical protein